MTKRQLIAALSRFADDVIIEVRNNHCGIELEILGVVEDGEKVLIEFDYDPSPDYPNYI